MITDALPRRRTDLFGGRYAGKKVLLTGHTGFKGAWLTAWLLSLGAEVIGFSCDVPTSPSLFEQAAMAKRMEDRRGDIRDLPALEEAVRATRPDFVFHLAAQAIVSESYRDPIETVSSNVVGTACMLQALRQVDWPCSVIIVTSDKCYENVEWPWGYRETDRLGGKDVYSASKGAAELIFSSFQRSFFGSGGPVRIASCRAGNVVGGGDWARNRIVADCVRSWSGSEPVLIRSPGATRPWQHVLEPLSGYLTLAGRMTSEPAFDGTSFNFGPRADQDVQVRRLIEDLSRVWGVERPEEAYRLADEKPFKEAGLLKLSCDKALNELEWEPNLAYDECVDLTGSWYRRVVKENEDAEAVTAEQIDMYEGVAHDRGRIWLMPWREQCAA